MDIQGHDAGRGMRGFARAYSEQVMPVVVSSPKDEPLRWSLTHRSSAGVDFSRISVGAHRMARLAPPKEGRLGGDRTLVHLQLAGSASITTERGRSVLGAHDLFLWNTRGPFRVEAEGAYSALVMVFPAAALDLPEEHLRVLSSCRIPRGDDALQMVLPFFAALANALEEIRGGTGDRLAGNALGLLSCVLHCRLRSEPKLAQPRRERLIGDAKSYLDRHLGDSTLSANDVAAHIHISTRYFYSLFSEVEGTTVGTWIRRRRLEACRRDLADPGLEQYTIQDVMTRWGFDDAAHFSRLFKATYRQTPTDWRRCALGTVALGEDGATGEVRALSGGFAGSGVAGSEVQAADRTAMAREGYAGAEQLAEGAA